ncbi:MAG: hypothetical protein AB7S57_03225 [Acetobacteraceae bacterium]
MTIEPHDCVLNGSALTETFLRHELGHVLARLGLLPAPNRALAAAWRTLRQHLDRLGRSAGPQRVRQHVLAPLAPVLGYASPVRQTAVATREGTEDGGWLLRAGDGTGLRVWPLTMGSGLDAPPSARRAYRHGPTRSAFRVLRATDEHLGLLTDGDVLRVLVRAPAAPDSHITMPLTGPDGWRHQGATPDSFRLLLALASPRGIGALPGILDAARLHQTRVTRDLRRQARDGLEGFLRAVVERQDNAACLRAHTDPARALWEDGLILVHRLLFILKLEGSAERGQGFSFASTMPWRCFLSPNQALASLVRGQLDQARDTGRMLEDGLRAAFRAFRDGLSGGELCIAPLGGALFGKPAMRLLDGLSWGERGVALLLDRLLWTAPRDGARERVHYGALDVEELGGVYEALLELEPGIAAEPMVRLRRNRLEIVVPARLPASYCERVEDIPAGRFFLRAGGERKASGSFYTPHGFVRFLVREALDRHVHRLSPRDDPDPASLLSLRLVDPATGSGHFLVEACRQLGEALHTACVRCDELAASAEARAASAPDDQRPALLDRARVLRQRLAALPDTDGLLAAYLPSRCPAGGGVAEWRAQAICRRLVAVHCLYGVDQNRMAVELAKLALWLESHAEGLPLTFLDHRLLQADSLAGPFFEALSTLPVGGAPLDPLLARGVAGRLEAMRTAALAEVRALEASIGRDVADLVLKEAAKRRLDAVQAPLMRLARTWSGAAMMAAREANDEYLALARCVAGTGAWPDQPTARQHALEEAGALALPWDLAFPEVFHRPGGGGFDAVLGNPPWDVVQHSTKDFVAGFDLAVLDAPTKRERAAIEALVLADPAVAAAFTRYKDGFDRRKRIAARLFRHQTAALGTGRTAGNLDLFRLFAERSLDLAAPSGAIGMLLPSAFHANEGTTGIRTLYLDNGLDICLSFENRRKLFDIDSRFKFALVVLRRPGPAEAVRCGFYLDRIEQIDDPDRIMRYDRGFLAASGGEHATFLELRGSADLAIARRLFAAPHSFGAWCRTRGIRLGRDLHMTDDAGCFVSGGEGYVLHEGKTFHQYTDRWDTAPRYCVPAEGLAGKPLVQQAAGHFRLAFRDIARSTDERSAIAAILPSGVVCGHTATVERTPWARDVTDALLLCALMNSHPFDWLVRQKAAAHLSLYLLDGLPVPDVDASARAFLSDGALRLSCNHPGYAPLWRACGGTAHHWPVLADATGRLRLRAAMDAVIARCFGLGRSDYAHILGAFSHSRHRSMAQLCLQAFDELPA